MSQPMKSTATSTAMSGQMRQLEAFNGAGMMRLLNAPATQWFRYSPARVRMRALKARITALMRVAAWVRMSSCKRREVGRLRPG